MSTVQIIIIAMWAFAVGIILGKLAEAAKWVECSRLGKRRLWINKFYWVRREEDDDDSP